MKKKVILVHGFNKGQSDMVFLKEELEDLGYHCIAVNLPLKYKTLQQCNFDFAEILNQIISGLIENEKISLVGHSTGGLIIRCFLSSTIYVDKIDRCVLIATPNQGSELACLASKFMLSRIYKTMDSLKPDNSLRIFLILLIDAGEPINEVFCAHHTL